MSDQVRPSLVPFVGAGINWNSAETESEENEIFIALN
jgi:hypothetical protein